MSTPPPPSLFSGPIATIFAVEVLEATIIVGQYRTILLRSADWSGDRQQEGLKCIRRSVFWAALGALVVCAAIAIPLGILSKELDPRVGDIIEGSSKCVAAFFILKLSLKIPPWLEVYPRVAKDVQLGLTLREIRFNVSWNIWREVAECGIFLIPFILGSGAETIPISAIVGNCVGGGMGGLIYIGNKKLSSKKWLCIFMCLLLVFVSAGLIVGGVHEFEEVFGETPRVWTAENPFWSSKSLPMILLKPLGYSSYRTTLQMVTFWSWLLLASVLHFCKYRKAATLVQETTTTVKNDTDTDESEEAVSRRSNSIDNDVDETTNNNNNNNHCKTETDESLQIMEEGENICIFEEGAAALEAPSR